MKKKKLIRIGIVVAVLAVVYGLLVAYHLVRKEASGRFCDNTIINDMDVSGKSLKGAMQVFEKNYSKVQIELTENGEQVLTTDLAGAGYSFDEEALQKSLNNLIDQQNQNLLLSLIRGNTFTMEIPYQIDEQVMAESICAEALSAPRIPSENARMDNNGSECYIIPEVYGNEFVDADLQEIVREQLKTEYAGTLESDLVSIEIPSSIYILPEITSEDEALNQTVNLYNSFKDASVTYLFGSEKKTLDWSVIYDWIDIADGTATINADKAYAYVTEVANAYDTIYTQRSFTAHDGRTITLPSNDYGYRIDKDGEYAQLIADITSNTSVEREPVYSIRGYTRNGRDDLCGTYIEADLTNQHLWFYKNGSLVIDTDFVSGLPKDGRETTTGAFPIPYKASPFNLSGGGSNGSDSWDVTVQYWMPFYDGQGLHDASWRSSFGGSIYATNGSHGCINLPTAAAKVIYDNLESNMPILLYK